MIILLYHLRKLLIWLDLKKTAGGDDDQRRFERWGFKKNTEGEKLKIDMFYFAATTWLRISTLIKFSHSSNQTVLQSLSKYYSWLPLGILDFVCPSRPLALRPCITALCLFLISGWRDESAEWEPSICGCMWAIFQRCGQKSFCTLHSVKLFISLQNSE